MNRARELTSESRLCLAVNAYLSIGDRDRLAEAIAELAPEGGVPKVSGRYAELLRAAKRCLTAVPIDRPAADEALAALLQRHMGAILADAALRALIPDWARRAKPARVGRNSARGTGGGTNGGTK